MDEDIGRRSFLKASAVTLTGIIGFGRSAAGDSPKQLLNSTDGPVLATGKRFHRYKPAGNDIFIHAERFTSDDLVDKYGKATVQFEEERIAREVAHHDLKENEITVIEYEDTAIIGAIEEHSYREQHIGRSSERRNSITPKASYYSGPKFVYKLQDNGSLGEATGPLNVAWENDAPIYVHYTMLDGGWSNDLPAGDRYIIGNGEYQKQWGHVMKEIFLTEQYHGRVYSINDVSTNYTTACQMHHDPLDHGHIGDPDTWKFNESRSEAVSFWSGRDYSVNYQAYGLNQWPSADAHIAKLAE